MKLEDLRRATRLTFNLARYEINAQRKETLLGLVWIVVWPMLQAGGFLLAFSLIRGGSRPIGFETILSTYLGVLIWTTASSVLITNLNVLKSNRELITQIVFSFSILSVVDVTVKYIFFLIQFVFAVGLWFLMVPNEQWPLIVAYLPIFLAAFYLALLAMAWVASICGVALPDLSFFLPTVLILLLALSPIFQRNVEAMPRIVELLNEINPFSIWVGVFYSTIDVAGAGPSMPFTFLASAVLAVIAARFLVRVFYREMARLM